MTHSCYAANLAEFAFGRDLGSGEATLVSDLQTQSHDDDASIKSMLLTMIDNLSIYEREVRHPMNYSKRTLNRRAFLYAAGTAGVALPFLEGCRHARRSLRKPKTRYSVSSSARPTASCSSREASPSGSGRLRWARSRPRA